MSDNTAILDDMFKDKKQNATDVPTELICIVDRSGSMQSIKADAEGGLNAFIAEQAKLPGEANLTIIEFDNFVDEVCRGVKIQEAVDYKLVPRGMTAMYDAIGYAIGNHTVPEGTSAVVVIVTDGHENASSEWDQSRIFDLITEKTEAGWDFIFLAANQDAMSAGGGIGISADTSFNFTGDAKSVQDAYATASVYASATRAYSGSMDVGEKQAVFKQYIDDNIDDLDISK